MALATVFSLLIAYATVIPFFRPLAFLVSKFRLNHARTLRMSEWQVVWEVVIRGQDRDSNGNVIPGVRIKHTYDLAEMDLCWAKNLLAKPAFQTLVNDIRARFHSL